MDAALETYRNASARERRDRLILEHLDYVRHVLGRIVGELPPGLDYENLEAAGVLGLVEAAAQFDPDRGVPFLGFATHRIRGAIIDELRRNCPLPQAMLEKVNAIREAYRVLPGDAAPRDVAAHVGLSLREVEECLEAARLTQMESLPDDIRAAAAQASGEGSPQDAMEHKELRGLLRECLEAAPERERLVLSLYYLEELRLKEIGRVMHLSESRVCRILAQAESRVRGWLQRRLNRPSVESPRWRGAPGQPGG